MNRKDALEELEKVKAMLARTAEFTEGELGMILGILKSARKKLQASKSYALPKGFPVRVSNNDRNYAAAYYMGYKDKSGRYVCVTNRDELFTTMPILRYWEYMTPDLRYLEQPLAMTPIASHGPFPPIAGDSLVLVLKASGDVYLQQARDVNWKYPVIGYRVIKSGKDG